MSLGGGTFKSFTKVIPGVYTNVKGSPIIKEMPTRGYVAVAVPLKWGDAGFTTVFASEIEETCMEVFGYDYSDNEMTWLREIIAGGATVIYVYNLNSSGAKATGTFCTAKKAGTRGNDIKITIEEQSDDSFDVILYVGTTLVDTQNVTNSAALKDNAYVTYDKTATLAETSQTTLTTGADGTVATTAHETFLNACESKYINVIVCNSTDATVTALYAEYAKKFVEETALKTQVAIYQKEADFYGTLDVYHPAASDGPLGVSGFTFWFAGAIAGLLPGECLTNKKYTGELKAGTTYTNAQLKTHITNGHLVFNVIDDELKVAKEVNSLTTFTEEIGKSYALNQHIRIINDILTEQSKILSNNHLGTTLPGDNGIGSIYSDMFGVLSDAFKSGYLKLPYTDDLKIAEVPNDKAAISIEQEFETIVCLDKFYISTIAD